LTIGVVVDVDDTLLNTDRRRWAVWCRVLGREVPLQTVESLSSLQILERFAGADRGLWERFWGILLCWEESGIELLDLDEPIPYAAEVLQRWSKEYKLIYLTGRSRNMRKLTLGELDRFGFPVRGVDLVMLKIKDWKRYLASETSPITLRARMFSSVLERHRVVRVVDDYPIFFTVYRRYGVPDRVGLLRPKRFSPQEYFAQGATRVVEGWQQLQDDVL